MPAAVTCNIPGRGPLVAAVMTGVGPRKSSDAAVAAGADEAPLGQVRVRALAAQATGTARAACITTRRSPGQDRQRSVAGSQAPGQRRPLQASEGRRRPGGREQRERPGRASGERPCRQRGRIAPRTPALRQSHSRAFPNPATPTPSAEKGHVNRSQKDRRTTKPRRASSSMRRPATRSSCRDGNTPPKGRPGHGPSRRSRAARCGRWLAVRAPARRGAVDTRDSRVDQGTCWPGSLTGAARRAGGC